MQRHRETLTRFIRYGIIGASGIGVNFLVLRGVWPWLHGYPEAASGVAIEVSILSNYVLNTRFTFRLAPRWHSMWRYNVAMAGGGVVQTGIFALLLRFNIYYLWANLIAIPVATVLGFVLSQMWVFRSQERVEDDAGLGTGLSKDAPPPAGATDLSVSATPARTRHRR